MKGLFSAILITMLTGCGGGGTKFEDLPDSPDIFPDIFMKEAWEEAVEEIYEAVETETADAETKGEIPHECEKDEECAGIIAGLSQCEAAACESFECVKVNAPENSECDDGNPCTIGDRCSGGICIEGANYCECEEDKDCEQYEDGDLCNGTLYCRKETVPYKCDVKPGTIVTCEYPQKMDCLEYKCVPALGTCDFIPINEGDECDDKNPCSTQSFCSNGLCKGENDLICDDSDKCTSDACVFGVGCVYVDNSGACDDNNPCTEDSCDSEKGCLHKTIPGFECKQ